MSSPEELHALRHSASHVMAQAVTELFPGTILAIGPSTDDGFYYDLIRHIPSQPRTLRRLPTG